jgi:alpha-L-fucosidase
MDRRNFIAASAAAMAAGTLSHSAWAATGEDQAARDRRLAWWREARFGMFIHWGLYAVPAGEYHGRRIKPPNPNAEWIMASMQIPKAEYEKFAPQFNPVKFDPHAWARTAKDAGMKYLVITSKHHDGFAMFDSKLTDWTITARSPFKRDPLKELAAACADVGIRFGLYYSQLDWHYAYTHIGPDVIPHFKKYMKFMEGQLDELLTGYGPICSLFFDGDWMPQWSRKWGREVETFCRQRQPAVVINNRLDKRTLEDNLSALSGKPKQLTPPQVGDYATPEQTIPAELPKCDWETCMTMNDTWGFNQFDDNWKPAPDLVHKLIDIASKGGNFLLNVGPTSAGLIPDPSLDRLADVGKWMKTNGESIYGTSAGPLQQQSWGRTTSKPGKIFLHLFDWPAGPLTVSGLNAPVKKASFMADGAPLTFTASGPNLTLNLPPAAPDPVATVIMLES